MADLKQYEIRERGQFMMPGKLVWAKHHESAMLNPKDPIGDRKNDSIVIEIATCDFWLMLTDAGGGTAATNLISTESIHPYFIASSKRMALAIACEKTCQIDEEILNMEFSDFECQLKQYEKHVRDTQPEYLEKRKEIKRNLDIKFAEQTKELAIAEAEAKQGNSIKSAEAFRRRMDARTVFSNLCKIQALTSNINNESNDFCCDLDGAP